MKINDYEKYKLLYQALVDQTGIGIWEYDIEKKTATFADIVANKVLYFDFGFPRVIENLPHSLLVYVDQEYVDGYVAMFRAIDAGADRAECTIRYKLMSTVDERYEHITMITIRDETGHPVSAVGIARNITAQVKEQHEYDELNLLFNSMLSNSVASTRLDISKNKVLAFTSKYASVEKSIKSDTVDGLMRNIAGGILDEKIRREFQSQMNCLALLRSFNIGDRQISFDYPVIGFSGDVKWMNGRVIMSHNPTTGTVEAVTWSSDITKRKNRKILLDRLTSGYFTRICIISCKTGVMSGLTDAEVQSLGGGKEIIPYSELVDYMSTECVLEEDREYYLAHAALDRINRELESCDVYRFPFSQIIDGKKTRIQAQFTWLNREYGQILHIANDITESYDIDRNRIRQVESARMEAERARYSRVDFLTRISHDIRTPIGIISNMADFAMQDMGNPEKLKKDLARIRSANQFLLSLISDVLDIEDFESGKITLKEEPYPYEEVAQNLQNIFKPLCEEKNITFTMTCNPPFTDLVILADRVRMNQIALNLVGNAIKYTPKGGRVWYNESLEYLGNDKARLTVTVGDTGIGMKESFVKEAFEPFSQELDNPKREKKIEGTGLGLSIVHRLVELMNGTIRVTSKLGKGTEFQWTAVFNTVLKDTAGVRIKTIVPVIPSEKNDSDVHLSGTVLLVDDNEINREIAIRILRTIGLSAVEAVNGKEGVEQFKNAPEGTYLAVLMDIQMPVMDGYNACRAIRSLGTDDAKCIPIIAVTANAFQDAVGKAVEAGMNDLITKPLQRAVLLDVLKSHIRKVG